MRYGCDNLPRLMLSFPESFVIGKDKEPADSSIISYLLPMVTVLDWQYL